MPPPNTPEEGLLPPSNSIPTSRATTATLPLRPIVRNDVPTAPTVDLRALEYEGVVDENLICPICHVAFVEPVITTCDHVFCHQCLVQAHALNPICPVDRLPLKLASDTKPAPKIVHNQLDNLNVRCPNRCRGCDLTVARSLVENHVARYCDKTLVPCPHTACDKLVVRRDTSKGCLHFDVECEYCKQIQQKADLEHHQDSECPNRTATCSLCDAEFVRHKKEQHIKECPETEAPCKYAAYGCTRTMCRKHMDAHGRVCDYRVVGPVGEQLAELRAELKLLKDKDRLKDRRIKFLENRGSYVPSGSSAENIADMNLPGQSNTTETAPYESRDQYFLSLFETMESKVERLSSALTEVEARHSMMLFNETLQVKDQLAEIRSTQGVLGMHVRWLMNFRLQERGRVGASASGVPETFTGNHETTAVFMNNIPPRRLSDTYREDAPRL